MTLSPDIDILQNTGLKKISRQNGNGTFSFACLLNTLNFILVAGFVKINWGGISAEVTNVDHVM